MLFWIFIWWTSIVYCTISSIFDNGSFLCWAFLSILLGPIALFLYKVTDGDIKKLEI